MGGIADHVDALLSAEEGWHENPSALAGYPTGYQPLDEILLGLENGKHYVFGARTSQGKTAFSLPIAFNVARFLLHRQEEEGIPAGKVLIFSPEMTGTALLSRFVSTRTKVRLRKLKKGTASEEDRRVWREAMQAMTKYHGVVEIASGEGMDVASLCQHVEERNREFRSAGGVRFVLIDYIQLVEGQGRTAYEKATYTSQRLKGLSNKLDIPILSLSQFRRPDIKPGEKERKPTMYEFRDSGDIEQSADVIGILFRPLDSDDTHVRSRRSATFEITKHRDGPLGSFTLGYDPPTTTFVAYMDELFIDGEYENGKPIA